MQRRIDAGPEPASVADPSAGTTAGTKPRAAGTRGRLAPRERPVDAVDGIDRVDKIGCVREADIAAAGSIW